MSKTLEKKTLREWRQEAGLLQRELAEIACCAVDRVRDIENGNTRPTAPSGQSIASALGVSVAQILKGHPRNRISVDELPEQDPLVDAPKQTLEWWRKHRSLGKRELSQLAGLSYHAVWKIEANGGDSVTPKTRRRLAKALGIAPDRLILPGDDAVPDHTRSELDYLRAELRGARRALRKSYDFLREDPNITFRALDKRDALLKDVEREIRGL